MMHRYSLGRVLFFWWLALGGSIWLDVVEHITGNHLWFIPWAACTGLSFGLGIMWAVRIWRGETL